MSLFKFQRKTLKSSLLSSLAMTLMSVTFSSAVVAVSSPQQLQVIDQAPDIREQFYPNVGQGYFAGGFPHNGHIFRNVNGSREICTGDLMGMDIWSIQGPSKNPTLVKVADIKTPNIPSSSSTLYYNWGASNALTIQNYKGKDVLVLASRVCSPGWCSDNTCSTFVAGPGTSNRNAFAIYDIKNPAKPRELLSLRDELSGDTAGQAPVTVKYKDKLYLMTLGNSPNRVYDFTMHDISNPQNPVIVGGFNIKDLSSAINGFWRNRSPTDVYFQIEKGKLLGVHSVGDAGIFVVDWSDPGNPTLVRQTLLPRDPLNVLNGPELSADAPNRFVEGGIYTSNGKLFAPTVGFGNTRTSATIVGLGGIPAVEADGARLSSYPGSSITGKLVVSSGTGIFGLNLACDSNTLPSKSDYAGCTGQNCILAIARGTCSFTLKASNVTAKGWDGILIVSTSNAIDAFALNTIPWAMVNNEFGQAIVDNNPSPTTGALNSITLSSSWEPFGHIRMLYMNDFKSAPIQLATLSIPETLDQSINLSDLGLNNSGGFSGSAYFIDKNSNLMYTSWGSGGKIVYDISDCLKAVNNNNKAHFNRCNPIPVATFTDPNGFFTYKGKTIGPTDLFPIQYKNRTLHMSVGRDSTLYLLDDIKKKK